MTQTSKQRSSFRASAGAIGRIEPRFFRALADRNRVALLARLAGCAQPCSVSELACCCPVDLSVVSRHLALLRDAGLVAAKRRGKTVYYEVRYHDLIRTLRELADALETCCPDEPFVSKSKRRTTSTRRAAADNKPKE